MSKIDPRMLAVGLGGLAGANMMSMDNDPIAMAAGIAIGAGTAAMADLSLPSDLKMKANRLAGNTFMDVDPNAISGRVQTFDELKETVKQLGVALAKKSSSTASAFDSAAPYSTLSQDTFQDFSRYVSSMTSEETLRELKLALQLKNDAASLATGSLNVAEDLTDEIQIKSGAPLKAKMKGLETELKRLGYEGQDLFEKMARFEPLLAKHSDSIRISDGQLDLIGTGKIRLTHTLGTGTDAATVYTNNRNMYDVKQVNLFAGAMLENPNLNVKAVADALGIVSADLFDINAQLNKVAGIAPDDAIAMMAKVLNKEQLAEFIEKMSANYDYNEDLSGQLKGSLLGLNAAPSRASSHSISASNTVEYKDTINLDREGKVRSEKPFRKLSVTSADGRTMSESKQFSRLMSSRTGQAFYGVSADHITQLPASFSPTNKPMTVHAPMERNPHTVGNRATVASSNSELNTAVKKVIEQLGGKHTFASAVAVQSFSVDPGKEIVNVGGQAPVRVMDLIADVFGSDRATGDGYGLANQGITKNITTEGLTSAIMRHNSNGNYVVESEAMRKFLTGQVSLEDMKKQALIGATVFSGRTADKLKEAQSRLLSLGAATNESEVFDFLKDNYKSFSKYKDYSDFAAKSKSIRNSSNPFQDMRELASRMVLGKQLASSDSLYHQSFKDRNHFDVVKSVSKIDKELRSLQKAVSSGNFHNASGIIGDLLDHNEKAKQHIDAFRTYFPQAGSVIGYNNDTSPVKIKENYRFLEFQGVFKAIDGSESTTREAIQFMYKGMNRAGFETISKTYGVSSKEQIKHIESNVFSTIGSLLDAAKNDRLSMNNGMLELVLANSAKPVKVSPDSLRGGDFLGALQAAGATKEDLNVAKKSFDFFKANVGTISEDGGSGMKSAEDLYKQLSVLSKDHTKTEGVRNMFLSENLMYKTLVDKVTSGNLTDNQLKGLSNFAVSLSRDRASMSYLVTTAASIQASANLKVSNYTNAIGTVNEGNALAALRSFAVDILGDQSYGSGQFNVSRFNTAISDQISGLSSIYGDAAAVETFYKDPAKLSSLANMFMAERTYRLDSIGDSVIQMSAFNTRTESETGAGKTGKSMSWNVQTQLKMNGLTDADLASFGGFNANNIADLQSVLVMRAKQADSVNADITDNNREAFKRALSERPTKRREALAKAGIQVDGLIGAYKLSYENKLGLTHMPIMLENSSLFGTYTDEFGNLAEKQVNKLASQIILEDMRLSNTDLSPDQRGRIKTSIDEKLQHLGNMLKDVVGGQDNILKTALAREANTSMYSTMVPVSGDLERLAGEGKSAVSVSSEGLVKRFKELGYNYNSIDEIEQAGHLKKDGRLMKVFLDQSADLPMFGIINREPATGPGSARFVEYYLDKTLTNDSKSLHVAANDVLYKYFQFGDFDLDHTLEYMPKVKGVDTDFLKQMLAKGTKVNDTLLEIVEYSSMLGVKGSQKGKIGTLFDVYERHGGNFATTQDWMTAYLEDEIIAKHKGGDRKAISPTVTKLAADINDAIARAETGDTKTYYNARVLSHYFVENLLKSQHIDSQKYGQMTTTMAEQLQSYMSNGRTDASLSRFKQEFTNYINETVVKSIQQSSLSDATKEKFIKDTDDAIKLISESLHYDSERGPTTPMHARAPSSVDKLGETIDGLVKYASANGPAVDLLPITEHTLTDVNDMSLAQKGKLGYHSVLESMKHTIGNNKKLLAGAGAASIGAALLLQSKPDFGDNRASANPGGMLMAPAKSALEDTANEVSAASSLNRAVDYIRPYKRDGASYASISATPRDGMDQNYNQFIFGDGLSSARIIDMSS